MPPAMRATCAFCLTETTTASLDSAGDTPICWRPCYAALCKIEGGMNPARALVLAFDEAYERPDAMLRLGFSPAGTALRLTEYVLRTRMGLTALQSGAMLQLMGGER